MSLDDLFKSSNQRVNDLIKHSESSSSMAEQLRCLLTEQIQKESQLKQQLRERVKELTCISEIRFALELNLPVHEMLRQVLQHLIIALQFPEIAAGNIELNGEQIVSGNDCNELAGIHSAISVNHEIAGQINLFYREDKALFLPEEQNLINIIAADLAKWFERSQMIDSLRAALHQSEMLQLALDEHSIVAITDHQGKITYTNDKFCQISKYSREELLGQDHRIINSGFHPKEFWRHLWKTIAKGHVWKDTIRNRAKDGSFYWVETTIVPFLDTHKKPYQYISIRTDITRHKEMESLLDLQVKELARANNELEQFTYVATHDLQEPLRSVSGCVLLLKERYGNRIDERADEFISHAVDGVERMKELINDLSIYSRIDAPKNKIPIDCQELLNSVLVNIKHGISESKAEITYTSLPTIYGIRSQLAQVFQNLIMNAIKFCEEPPRIHISATLKDNQWIFSVADNGIGIEAQYFDRIFRVFQRLHTRKRYPGTGIGLSICKKIVENHNGQIWVKSEPGKGSTFYFSIPEKRN